MAARNHKIDARVRRQAIKLFGLGYDAAHIARQLGVHGQTIRNWVRKAGMEKGALLKGELPDENEDITPITIELPKQEPLVREIVRRRENAAIQQAVDVAASPVEQFQTLVAAKGIKILSEAFENPPRPKNVRDMKVLADMVGEALGISKKGGSGGKLAIDLTVLTKPANQLTIDVSESDGR